MRRCMILNCFVIRLGSFRAVKMYVRERERVGHQQERTNGHVALTAYMGLGQRVFKFARNAEVA